MNKLLKKTRGGTYRREVRPVISSAKIEIRASKLKQDNFQYTLTQNKYQEEETEYPV